MIKGVISILCTPFDRSETVDFASLRHLVRWQLERGVSGVAALGIFGEVAKLTDRERDEVVAQVVDTVAGRVPVVVGTGHLSTRVACEQSRRAKALGADGVMVIPSRNCGPWPLLVEYYRRVADAAGCPVIVQDEPTTSGVILGADSLCRLAEEVEPVVAVKLEEAPTVPKVTAILERRPQLAVLGGNGGVFFLEELERGAVGTMTGFAFPEALVAVWQAFTAGERERARDLFERMVPMARYENQAGIALSLRKEILRLRGAIVDGRVRSPAPALDAVTLQEVGTQVERMVRKLDEMVPAGGDTTRPT